MVFGNDGLQRVGQRGIEVRHRHAIGAEIDDFAGRLVDLFRAGAPAGDESAPPHMALDETLLLQLGISSADGGDGNSQLMRKLPLRRQSFTRHENSPGNAVDNCGNDGGVTRLFAELYHLAQHVRISIF